MKRPKPLALPPMPNETTVPPRAGAAGPETGHRRGLSVSLLHDHRGSLSA